MYLRGEQAVPLVDVVAGLADLAHASGIENVAGVDGDIGGEAGVPDKAESFLAGGTYSVGANSLAVTGIIVADTASKSEPRDARGAIVSHSGIAVNWPNAASIPEGGSEGAGDALAVIRGVVGQAG